MRSVLLIILSVYSLWGQTISAGYDVTFSIFGKIGEADVYFWQQDGRYAIRVDAGLTGEAASLGSHRREIHESFGIIKEGALYPELYKITRSSDHYYNQTFFVMYPDEKRVEEHRLKEKYLKESHFDIKAFKIVETPKTIKRYSMKELDYYAPYDLLSLFFNVRTLLGSMNEGDSRVIHAVGGSNKKGEVLVTNPAGAKRQELARLMPQNDNRLITVVINQDIFKSDKGELYINLDETLLIREAMLKDVLLFGDIHGYRIWKKEE